MRRRGDWLLRISGASFCVGVLGACAIDDRIVDVAEDDFGAAASGPALTDMSPGGVAGQAGAVGSGNGFEPMNEASGVSEGTGGAPPLDTPSSGGNAPQGAGAAPAEQGAPEEPSNEPAPSPAPDRSITIGVLGAGRVTSTPAGIDCPGVCTARFAGGSVVTLTAAGTPGSGSYFEGWSGDCTDFDECSLEVDQDHAVAASFGPANIAFVTSELFEPSQIGGSAAADAICRNAAAAAGLEGRFVAWLSDSSLDAINRVRGLRVSRGWVRPDGLEVGDTLVAMLAGEMLHPIRVDETGVDVGDRETLTGTNEQGRWSQNDCNGWSDASGEGTFGSSSSIGTFFTNVVTAACDGRRRGSLHCFGTDRTVRVEPRRSTGRLAFLSRGLFAPGAGVAAADALCQSEAQAAGRSGTFRAQLALSDSLPEARFDTSGLPWVRPDGVLVAKTAAGYFRDPLLDSPVNVSLDGAYQSSAFVWWGRTRNGLSNSESTCASWTSTTTTGLMLSAATTVTASATIPLTCAQSARVICLEN